MDEERERKLASLRNRVRSQLKSDTSNKEIKKPGLLEKANTKILEKNEDQQDKVMKQKKNKVIKPESVKEKDDVPDKIVKVKEKKNLY